MLKILFIGDISGKIGRRTVEIILPKLKKELKPDLVIANAENIAHGAGTTEQTLKEMLEAGVDYFTNGDHAFDKLKQAEIYDRMPALRPANFPPGLPGKGYAVIKTDKKGDVLLINLIGRVFMKPDYDDPFRALDEILKNQELANKKFSAIIIDMHAEATSEKISLGFYADGRVSSVLGTHTHVMTADEQVTDKGMAYISDVGMTGFADGCLGVEKEGIIKAFLGQVKYPHVIPEKGKAIFSAVMVQIDEKTGKAIKITPIKKFIEIK